MFHVLFRRKRAGSNAVFFSGEPRGWLLPAMAVLMAFQAAVMPVCSDDTVECHQEKSGKNEPVSRPRKWAAPLEKPGLGNLFKVTDGLYRGRQPSARGIRELKKMGIKTILSLRSSHSDRAIIDDAGLTGQFRYIRIPMKPDDPQDDAIVTFLKIVTRTGNQPVLVHCAHGADRTGWICAAYRMVVEGWPKEEAIDEMINGGFGFHTVFVELPEHLKNMDVGQIRERVGLPAKAIEEKQTDSAAPDSASPGLTSPHSASPARTQLNPKNVPVGNFAFCAASPFTLPVIVYYLRLLLSR